MADKKDGIDPDKPLAYQLGNPKPFGPSYYFLQHLARQLLIKSKNYNVIIDEFETMRWQLFLNAI